ncbi:hypothetical protein NMY22_g5830 [Coprinellus aureogranulatus]|nr:hypothetical protein NMY22_g5830 [Coprinellus aureogranulatus]
MGRGERIQGATLARVLCPMAVQQEDCATERFDIGASPPPFRRSLALVDHNRLSGRYIPNHRHYNHHRIMPKTRNVVRSGNRLFENPLSQAQEPSEPDAQATTDVDTRKRYPSTPRCTVNASYISPGLSQVPSRPQNACSIAALYEALIRRNTDLHRAPHTQSVLALRMKSLVKRRGEDDRLGGLVKSERASLRAEDSLPGSGELNLKPNDIEAVSTAFCKHFVHV